MTLTEVQNSSKHCCSKCPGGHFQKVGECVALCNVSRYVTKSRDMRESDLVREMFFVLYFYSRPIYCMTVGVYSRSSYLLVPAQ